MSMSEEEINALNENLKQLNETMTLMVETMGSVTNQSKLTSRELGKLKTSVKDTDDAIDDLREGSVKTKGALNNLTESSKKYEKQQDAIRDATRSAVTSVARFADSLISTEKGFNKFSGSITSAGDSAFELGKSFGGLGAVVGGLVKFGTMLIGVQLKQADAVFNARNELFKFAGAGSVTSQELLDMGQAIGLTSDQLDSLVKPLKNIGSDLLTLGMSAGEGAKLFGKIGDVEDETRKRFIRLGVMPEELLETQADFIRLQRMAGVQATLRMKTDKEIQKDSLEYAESLKVLSEFTGLEAEEVKKRQQAVLDDFRFQAMMTQRNQQEAELRKRGDAESIAQADEMKKVTENMVKSLEIASAFSPELAEKARSLILTGGNITEFTASLGIAGVNTRKFAEAMERGDPDAMLNFLQDVGERVADQAGKFGDVVGYLDDETLKMLGLTKGSMEFITKYMNDTGKSFADAYQEVAKRVGEAGEGGIDTLADNQAALTTTQMRLAAGFDNLVEKTNILISGFTFASIAVTALGAAAGIAALTLSGKSLFRGLSSLFKGGAGGTNTGGGGGGAGLGGVLGTGAKLLGKAVLPIMAGLSVFNGIRGFGADPTASTGRKFLNAGSGALNSLTLGMLGSSPSEIRERSAAGNSTTDSTGVNSSLDALKDISKHSFNDIEKENIKTNTELLRLFSDSMKGMPEIKGVKIARDIKMPWQSLKEFASVKFNERAKERITENAGLLRIFGASLNGLPEIKGVKIASDIKMPWQSLKEFADVKFNERAKERITENSSILRIFGVSLKDLPEIKGVKIANDIKMPWELLREFSDIRLDNRKVETNTTMVAHLKNAFSDMPDLSFSFSQESYESFDRLIKNLKDFQRLRGSNIIQNAKALIGVSQALSGIRRTNNNETSLTTPVSADFLDRYHQQVVAARPANSAQETAQTSSEPKYLGYTEEQWNSDQVPEDLYKSANAGARRFFRIGNSVRDQGQTVEATPEQSREAARQAREAMTTSPRNNANPTPVPTPEQVTNRILPEQQATNTTIPQAEQNNVENKTTRGLEEMTYTLASKLDRVIDLLDNSNDTQERLYRATV